MGISDVSFANYSFFFNTFSKLLISTESSTKKICVIEERVGIEKKELEKVDKRLAESVNKPKELASPCSTLELNQKCIHNLGPIRQQTSCRFGCREGLTELIHSKNEPFTNIRLTRNPLHFGKQISERII